MFLVALFQFDVTPTPIAQASALNIGSLLVNPIALLVYTLIGLVVGIWLIFFMVRKAFQARGRFKTAFGFKILKIRVPKERTGEEGKEDKSQAQIQELIGRMETV